MKSKITYFLTGLALAFWLFLFCYGALPSSNAYIQATTTDTVFVDRPYEKVVIKKIEVVKPVKVYIYERDTVYRQKIERDTLITALELSPKLAKIHTITPMGLPLVRAYPIQEFKQIDIDHKGSTKIKKAKHPRRKKVLKVLVKAGVFIGGVFVGSRL